MTAQNGLTEAGVEVHSIDLRMAVKLNLGNYQTMDVDITWHATLTPGKNPDLATQAISDRLRMHLTEVARPVAEKQLAASMRLTKVAPPALIAQFAEGFAVIAALDLVMPDYRRDMKKED